MQLTGRIGKDRFLSESPLVLAQQVRDLSAGKFSAAVVYPFDPTTEVGPFLGVSRRMAMAAPWVVGSLLQRSGFDSRIVQQVWNPNFQPRKAELNGRPLDMLAISSMIIHSAKVCDLIRDASAMGEARSFVALGGPKYIYQPTDAWRGTPDTWPDVVVTGEAHVLLSLLIRMLSLKKDDERLAEAWRRLCAHGEFHDIPGLVFRAPGDKLELINTGVPQMSEHLERPFAVEGLALYERPGKHEGLAETAMPLDQLGRKVQVVALPGFTEGCTRTCEYCPIPGRMQYSYRSTSEEFISQDILRTYAETGIKYYFAGDDSHFNSNFAERFWNHMAKVRFRGQSLRGQIKIGTEAVLADVEKRISLLPTAAEGGLVALWFGIETFNSQDLNKGQNPSNTARVFAEMRACGISPMAMTMLFPGQGWKRNESHAFGVSETVSILDRYGATSMQLTHLTTSPGSAYYDGHFLRQEVFSKVGRYVVGDSCFDGNRATVDFSGGKNPKDSARCQILILGAYWKFYHPGRLVKKLLRYWRDPTDETLQDLRFGWFGLGQVLLSTFRLIPWIWALRRGPWEKYSDTPEFRVPVQNVQSEAIKLRVPKRETVDV
ncbi:MAG: hypothetical protein A2846_01820 [Candidatus Doudnabacteria bacterium RIFCSPHIGHO2_01_FULL_49_9]|uniref:Elp3/MiaA/NifB-like radical SAM core domain-containing protein n=1 Tax=Candidatus Doudnabacteria bacterium RIFCSPHIGHO2_01_FULL_49_9 TaxID=1817827 RepID=A0A1F5NZI4_9BACT|nr:MAG: hypothetical protein A2846_01820 [Candidatus Doudnabacteria bacterium RIFCSPHIGHO2_01_FULL_49_9]